MSELTRFEDAFCIALAGEDDALRPWAAAEAPGLSVYRNTILKGAVDALVATHPTVERMVGEAWLNAAAAVFARDNPPRTPALQSYGEGFADWLERFAPAEDTPYLPAMARLDRLWWQSYFAGDAAPLTAADFAGLTPDALAGTVARLHPSVQLGAFDQNLASLWIAHQPPHEPPEGFEITDAPEWIVMARPGLEVCAQPLDRAAHAFLSACAERASLLTAAERALAADADAQFPNIIAIGLELGVFARLDSGPQGGTPP
jgi:hypothetical protein